MIMRLILFCMACCVRYMRACVTCKSEGIVNQVMGSGMSCSEQRWRHWVWRGQRAAKMACVVCIRAFDCDRVTMRHACCVDGLRVSQLHALTAYPWKNRHVLNRIGNTCRQALCCRVVVRHCQKASCRHVLSAGVVSCHEASSRRHREWQLEQ